MNKIRSAQDIQKDWDTNPRWKNVKRDYTAEEVVKLSGSVNIEYSLAKQGAEKLWNEINNSLTLALTLTLTMAQVPNPNPSYGAGTSS